LPFVDLVVEHGGQQLTVNNVLIDTGSAIQGIIGSDILNKIGAIVDFSAKSISLKE
jgi:hypothetical protein